MPTASHCCPALTQNQNSEYHRQEALPCPIARLASSEHIICFVANIITTENAFYSLVFDRFVIIANATESFDFQRNNYRLALFIPSMILNGTAWAGDPYCKQGTDHRLGFRPLIGMPGSPSSLDVTEACVELLGSSVLINL